MVDGLLDLDVPQRPPVTTDDARGFRIAGRRRARASVDRQRVSPRSRRSAVRGSKSAEQTPARPARRASGQARWRYGVSLDFPLCRPNAAIVMATSPGGTTVNRTRRLLFILPQARRRLANQARLVSPSPGLDQRPQEPRVGAAFAHRLGRPARAPGRRWRGPIAWCGGIEAAVVPVQAACGDDAGGPGLPGRRWCLRSPPPAWRRPAERRASALAMGLRRRGCSGPVRRVVGIGQFAAEQFLEAGQAGVDGAAAGVDDPRAR